MNRRGMEEGVVRTLDGESSDGKRRGPGIHKEWKDEQWRKDAVKLKQ